MDYAHVHADATAAQQTGEVRVTVLSTPAPKYVLHLPIEPAWLEQLELDRFVERLDNVAAAVRAFDIHRIFVQLRPDQLPNGLTPQHLLGMFHAALSPEHRVEFVDIDSPGGVDAVLL